MSVMVSLEAARNVVLAEVARLDNALIASKSTFAIETVTWFPLLDSVLLAADKAC